MELLATQHDAASSIQVLHEALSAEATSKQLKKQVSSMLYKSGIRLGGQRDDLSTELAARITERAWELREKYDPNKGSPVAWLCGISCKMFQEYLRQDRRQPKQLPDDPRQWDDLIQHVDDAIEKIDDHDSFELIKAQLTDAEQHLNQMKHIEGLDDRTVAERLGISHGAVRTRLSRLMHKLKSLADALKEGRS